MKKIAIVTRKMIIGGVEKALLSLLNQLDLSLIDIDLYLESVDGNLLNQIPSQINIIQIPNNINNLSYIIKHPYKYLKINISKLRIRMEKNYVKQCELTAKCLPIIEEKYDIAISYHAPNTVPVFYTINNINADKKILWLHGDIITNNCNNKNMYKYYHKYDKIFCVSKYIKETFDEYFAKLSDRTEVFYNFIDVENLQQLSLEGPTFNDNFKGTKILTIGRLDYQKGYDLAVKVCYKLKNDGYNIRWYICGEGNSRNEIEKLIKEYNLENEFILLGNQANPYGYLKDCDLYVQTSRYEGYCTTTNEARVFGKSIITTNVSGADEQFENKKTGLISDITIDSIYKNIKYLLDNPNEKKYIETNLKKTFKEEKTDMKKLTTLF